MAIHHYTRASTLPLILQSGRLRFTRADHLDDLTELPFDAFHLSRKACFINSWVKSDFEKSGQWYRYADQHRGVRVSVEGSPFPLKKLDFELVRPFNNKHGEHKSLGLKLNGVYAPFTKETMFGKGFVLVPWGDQESFGNDVSYVKNPTAYAGQFVCSTQKMTEIAGGSRFARIKSTHWEDQSEYRFTLMAIQGPDLIYQENPDKYENELLNLMERWQSAGMGTPPPEVQYIDLPIDTTMLNHMNVTLGSNISAEDREAVLRAINFYAPHAKISESAIKAR